MKDLLDDQACVAAEPRSFAGHRQGPHLHVTGTEDVLRPVAQRLAAIPSLPYLRGRLSLGTTDRILEAEIDDHLRLSAETDPAGAFAKILARATVLGMISGRGVPHSALAREKTGA